MSEIQYLDDMLGPNSRFVKHMKQFADAGKDEKPTPGDHRKVLRAMSAEDDGEKPDEPAVG